MKNKPLYIGLIAAVITCFAMYLDSKLFDTKKSFFTYIKNMILTGLLCIATFKLMIIDQQLNYTNTRYENHNNSVQNEPMFIGIPERY